jgi:hypothetical protein
MNRRLTRGLPIALLAGGVLLVTAATAIGVAGKSVTLHLLGGRTQRATACHQTHPHHYRLYRVNTKLSMEGWVVPAPALPDGAWRVKIKFKQCKLGRFVTVAEVHVKGRRVIVNGVKKGQFRYTRLLRARGIFFARAYYYGYTPTLISADDYFRVTR